MGCQSARQAYFCDGLFDCFLSVCEFNVQGVRPGCSFFVQILGLDRRAKLVCDSVLLPQNLDMQSDFSAPGPVVFRGERDGQLRQTGGWLQPWFFAERIEHAERYAGPGTEPAVARIVATNVLDLTEVENGVAPGVRQVIEAYAREFDDWVCRYSGEERDVWSYLECGDLYDYEGTGSGQRWNQLFRHLFDTFDAVRILDRTDGTNGQAVPVWVTASRDAFAELPPEEARLMRQTARQANCESVQESRAPSPR